MAAVLVLPGMITDPQPSSMIVAILGAGPAGMSCANACLSFGLTPVVIERDEHAGGAQRSNFHPNLWMLGAPGESGETMTRRMADHYASLPVESRFRTEVKNVEREDSGFILTLEGPGGTLDKLHAAAIVLATGMRPRSTLELDQLSHATRKVIIGPLSDTIRDGIRDASVLILGGGDNALDHALFLAERSNRVLVCARRDISARAGFLASCAERPEIKLRTGCAPKRLFLLGENIRAQWSAEFQDFDWLLVMFGYRPNTDVLECFETKLRPELTTSGHIHVDTWQRTSIPGIYAAGDLTDCPQPSVPTAIAQGLAAARAIERQGHDLPAGVSLGRNHGL
jgi:thioredoxin reductase